MRIRAINGFHIDSNNFIALSFSVSVVASANPVTRSGLGCNFSFLFFGRLLAEGSAVKEQRGFGQLAAFEMAFPAGVFTFLPIPESSD